MENVKNTEEIRMNASDFIDAFKKDPNGTKKQYDGKIIVLKGDITHATYDIVDTIKLNGKIICRINSRSGEKSFKDIFKEEELRYAVKGNKNILVRGVVNFGPFGIILMKKCDLFYEEKTPYVQEIDEKLNQAKKSARKDKKITYISCVIATISLLFSIVSPICIPLVGGLLFFIYIIEIWRIHPRYIELMCPGGRSKRDPFFLMAIANLLACGIKGLKIPTLLGTAGSFSLFPSRTIITEIYQGSVSPHNWINVELNKNTKNYLNIHSLLGNSLSGCLFQALLIIPSLLVGAIFVAYAFGKVPQEIVHLGMFNSFYVLIMINSFLFIKERSLFIKYTEDIAMNQKQWMIKKQ